MVLRFKSDSASLEYIAVNTALQTYTTKPEEVKRGHVVTVPCDFFQHIKQEINFNGYSYMDDLTTPAETEEIPLF